MSASSRAARSAASREVTVVTLGDEGVDPIELRSDRRRPSRRGPTCALSEEVLMPVSVERIACACRRHDTASSATARTSAASTVSSRSRAIDDPCGSEPVGDARARATVGLVAIDRDDQLVALVLVQLLAPGRHPVLAGDDEDAERSRTRRHRLVELRPGGVLGELPVLDLEDDPAARRARRRRRARRARRPSCRRPRRPRRRCGWRSRRAVAAIRSIASWTRSSKLKPLRVPASSASATR